jgi:hypothetical protein
MCEMQRHQCPNRKGSRYGCDQALDTIFIPDPATLKVRQLKNSVMAVIALCRTVPIESSALPLVVLIVEGVSFWKHPLMEDARNQNAATFHPVKQDMLAMLTTAQAGANVIADAAQSWVVGKLLATILKLVDIAGSLDFSPFAKSVIRDG